MPLVIPHLYIPTGGRANLSRYTTPDHADFAPNPPAGFAIEMRCEYTHRNLGVVRTLWGQWDGGSNQRQMLLQVGAVTALRPRFWYSTNGTDSTSIDADADMTAVNEGDRIQMRVRFVLDDLGGQKVCQFYYRVNDTRALTNNDSWIGIGSTITTAGTVTMHNSTAEVAIGRYDLGASDQQYVEVHQVHYKVQTTDRMHADFRSGSWEPTGTDAQGHVWSPQAHAQHRKPLFINTDKNHASTQVDITCTFPGATTAGNLLLAAAFGRGNVHDITTAGWTKAIDIQDVGNDDTLEVWYKAADGTETTVVFDVQDGETGTDLLWIGEYPGSFTVLDDTDSAGPTSDPANQAAGYLTATTIEQVVLAAISQRVIDAGVRDWSEDEFVPELDESNAAGSRSTLHVAAQRSGRVYSFIGADSSPWPTADWRAEHDVPNGGGADLQSNRGRIFMQSNAGGSGAGGRVVALMPRIFNGEVTGLIENGGASALDLVFYLRAIPQGWAGGDVPYQGYGVHFGGGTTNYQLYKNVDGVQTAIGALQNRDDQTPHRFRFQVVGNWIRCRAWKDGDTEPGTWDVQVNDTDIILPGLFTVTSWGARDNVLRSGYVDELTVENQAAMSTVANFQTTLTGGFSLGAIASFKAPPPTAGPVIVWANEVHVGEG